MRAIERSSAFKRDFKRVRETPRHRKDVDSLVSTVVALLVSDQVLPKNNRDHALSGNWVGCRECHIKPDLLLIYRKLDSERRPIHLPGETRELGAFPGPPASDASTAA